MNHHTAVVTQRVKSLKSQNNGIGQDQEVGQVKDISARNGAQSVETEADQIVGQGVTSQGGLGAAQDQEGHIPQVEQGLEGQGQGVGQGQNIHPKGLCFLINMH